MRENNFLPTLELLKWENSPDIDLILTDDGLDLDELLTYIEPTVIIAHRNSDFVDAPSRMKRVIYPMRRCSEQDFVDHGYTVTPLFKARIINRLCPDIPKETIFKVKHVYQN